MDALRGMAGRPVQHRTGDPLALAVILPLAAAALWLGAGLLLTAPFWLIWLPIALGAFGLPAALISAHPVSGRLMRRTRPSSSARPAAHRAGTQRLIHDDTVCTSRGALSEDVHGLRAGTVISRPPRTGRHSARRCV